MIKNIMKNIGAKPSVTEYVKALDTVNKLEAAYKKQKEDYDYTQRVKENGGDVSLMFPNNVKPKDLSENEDYLKAKNIIQSMELKDSAPEAKEDVDTDEFDSAGKKRPSTDVAYLKGWKDPQLKADVIKAIKKHNATGNNLLNVLYSKDKELYKKLDAMGTTNAEQFINQLTYDPEYDSEEK